MDAWVPDLLFPKPWILKPPSCPSELVPLVRCFSNLLRHSQGLPQSGPPSQSGPRCGRPRKTRQIRIQRTRCYIESTMTTSSHAQPPPHAMSPHIKHLYLPGRTWQSNSTLHLPDPVSVTFGLHLGRQESAKVNLDCRFEIGILKELPHSASSLLPRNTSSPQTRDFGGVDPFFG